MQTMMSGTGMPMMNPMMGSMMNPMMGSMMSPMMGSMMNPMMGSMMAGMGAMPMMCHMRCEETAEGMSMHLRPVGDMTPEMKSMMKSRCEMMMNCMGMGMPVMTHCNGMPMFMGCMPFN